MAVLVNERSCVGADDPLIRDGGWRELGVLLVDQHSLWTHEQIAAAIGRLPDGEREVLKADIVHNGCRVPLLYAHLEGKLVLVDGHQRLGICLELDRQPEFSSLGAVESVDEAIELAVSLQVNRRNLSDIQKRYLRGKHYNVRKGRRGGHRTAKSENVAEAVAQRFGVSIRTIHRDGQLAGNIDRLDAPIRDGISRGEIELSTRCIELLAKKPIAAQQLITDGRSGVEAAAAIHAWFQETDSPKTSDVPLTVAPTQRQCSDSRLNRRIASSIPPTDPPASELNLLAELSIEPCATAGSSSCESVSGLTGLIGSDSIIRGADLDTDSHRRFRLAVQEAAYEFAGGSEDRHGVISATLRAIADQFDLDATHSGRTLDDQPEGGRDDDSTSAKP